MLAHRILGGCSRSFSVLCPSLGSKMIVAAHPRPWSSFRRCSAFCWQTGKESLLLIHPKTIVSCLLGRSRLFPGLPPSYLWCTSPLQAMLMQPTPVLSLGSEAQVSAPSPHLPRQMSRQASQAGECWSAPIFCLGISPVCCLHPCRCTLLHGSKASPLPTTYLHQ